MKCSTLDLFAPEYSLRDLVNLKQGNRASIEYLWDDLLAINLFDQIPEMNVPVFFLTGRHDYVVPYELVEAYYYYLKAPYKELIWFENSAHSPLYEESDLFNQILIQQILSLTRSSGGD